MNPMDWNRIRKGSGAEESVVVDQRMKINFLPVSEITSVNGASMKGTRILPPEEIQAF